MKTVRLQRWLLLVPFLLIFAAVFTSIADANPTIHALLVIMDADASIGPSVAIDKQKIKGLLQEIKDKRVCDVQTSTLLSTKSTATVVRIKRWLNKVRPVSDDVVFVYFSGHGGMLKDRGTYIALQGDILFRKELVKAMNQAKDCRLKILITDNCSSLPESQVELQAAPSLEAAFRHLFVEHKGFLHLTAASEGEYAWGHSRRGGWFTSSLIDTIYERPDPNDDGFVSWKEVFQETRKKTMKLFEDAYPRFSVKRKQDLRKRGIRSQTPKSYSFPMRSW